MDRTKELYDILSHIRQSGHLGAHSIETVLLCFDLQLIQHTGQGNFELTDKGRYVLDDTPNEIV